MTVQQAEGILMELDIKIAFQHRFAGDKGTILRLDNEAMVNIFDDGRYYVQLDDSGLVMKALRELEEPWDPDAWEGPLAGDIVTTWHPPKLPPKRFEF